MSEPSHLPMQPVPDSPAWHRFSSDPRMSGVLRATDQDRDVARTIIAEAYAEGRLTDDEMRERTDRALQIRELQEFPLLLGDVLPAAAAPAQTPAVTEQPDPSRDAELSWQKALLLAVMVNVVWLFTTIFAGWYYYWPIWPMLAFAVGAIATQLNKR